jgi:hypothetical protein
MRSLRDRLVTVTVEAAKALIHARLRHHLAKEEQAVLRRRSRTLADHRDRIVDLAGSMEIDAEASWIGALALWRSWEHDETSKLLRLLIGNALAHAIRDSDHLLQAVLGRHPQADVKSWVLDFVERFNHESLLVWLRTDERRPVICRDTTFARTDTILAEDDVPF